MDKLSCHHNQNKYNIHFQKIKFLYYGNNTANYHIKHQARGQKILKRIKNFLNFGI